MTPVQKQTEDPLAAWIAVEKAATEFMQNLDARYEGDGLSREKAIRGSWYCPCVQLPEAKALVFLLERRGINQVYDLGAGDLRFAVFMDRAGFDVVAYEVCEPLLDHIMSRVDIGGVEVRRTDYYADYRDLLDTQPNSALVAFGGTNKLPSTPQTGVAVQGYDETGIALWIAGERMSFGLDEFAIALDTAFAETDGGAV